MSSVGMVMIGDTMVEEEEEVVDMIARGGPEVRASRCLGRVAKS